MAEAHIAQCGREQLPVFVSGTEETRQELRRVLRVVYLAQLMLATPELATEFDSICRYMAFRAGVEVLE